MSKKMTSAERFEAIDVAIGNLEGLSDTVKNLQNEEIPELFRRAQEWESLEQRVSNLEAGMRVGDQGNGDVPQVEERLVAIETTQKDLGDAMRDLTNDVKDAMAALRAEMGDIATSVKVLMMAVGNSTQEGDASERRGKVKVPEPKPYAGERDAQKLENFLFDMEQYFKAVGIASEEAQLNRATMYLTDNAKVWWRTKYQEILEGRCMINTWEELKQELKIHFYPENVDYLARRRLRDLRQTGSVQDYVKQFTTIMLDIRDMTEKDKLFAFVAGLSREAAMELQRRGVQSLTDAVTAAERLSDYDIGFPSAKVPKVGLQAWAAQSDKSSKSKSGGGGNGASSHLQVSTSSRTSNGKGKSKALACFLCNGPHRVKECPQKAALNALQAQLEEEVEKGDKGNSDEEQTCARVGAIRFLGPEEP